MDPLVTVFIQQYQEGHVKPWNCSCNITKLPLKHAQKRESSQSLLF